MPSIKNVVGNIGIQVYIRHPKIEKISSTAVNLNAEVQQFQDYDELIGC